VDLTLPPEELAHRLTMAGLEVEGIDRARGDWDDELVTVGLVLSVEPHPNADKLRLATVDLGNGEQLTVVCGAPNVGAGQKVAFARAGASLRDPRSGKKSVLKPARIRGIESAGMVCSESELGISEEHEGIKVLPDDAPVGEPLSRVLGDTILDIDMKPNRPDCLSMVGIAREAAALTSTTLREPAHTYEESDEPASQHASVEIADADLCSRYIATVVRDVTIAPSPPWMQERLIAAGMRPISNVVDTTNYVMLEYGQPLHAFDYDRLRGHKIIVRRARQGEDFVLLDGTGHAFTSDTLVIADAERTVAVAGVMGGLDSEVTDKTTNILLESANFSATSIRRTAARLKTRTEASARFEKGLSPELVPLAAARATKMLVEIAGGTALHGTIDVYPRPAPEVKVDLDRKRVEQVLGFDVPSSEVRSALTSLGFSCRWEPPAQYHVRVPFWRTDVRIQDDVIEEVARIIGYERIPTKGIGGEVPARIPDARRELRERLRDALAAAGMQEVITYSLTTLDALKRVVEPEELATYPPLRVTNPVSNEWEFLRPTLRDGVLRALGSNVRRKQGELALFEAARVFVCEEGRKPEEQEHIVGVVGGTREGAMGRDSGEPIDFFDAKGYVEAALEVAGINATFESALMFALVAGRTAEIIVDGKRAGAIGQVANDVAEAFGIEGDAILFELIVDNLVSAATSKPGYQPVSRFPSVNEDLAVLVDALTPAGDVQTIIESDDLVVSASVFDVYEGDRVPAGKKSVAFSVVYQAPDHTLSDEEVGRARRKIITRLERDVGAELRGGS
jgi:phenylalanyl-tRNA synthetase beta chain